MNSKRLIIKFGNHVEVSISLDTVTLYRATQHSFPPSASSLTTSSSSLTEVSNIAGKAQATIAGEETTGAISILPSSDIKRQYKKFPHEAITQYKRHQDKREVKWQLDLKGLVPQAALVIMIAGKALQDTPDLNELVIDIDDISEELTKYHREFAYNMVNRYKEEQQQKGENDNEEGNHLSNSDHDRSTFDSDTSDVGDAKPRAEDGHSLPSGE